jgi:hypothetical protein
MASQNEIRPLAQETKLSEREPAAGSCQICGLPLRSSRERDAQTCAYHLDVKPTPLN